MRLEIILFFDSDPTRGWLHPKIKYTIIAKNKRTYSILEPYETISSLEVIAISPFIGLKVFDKNGNMKSQFYKVIENTFFN